MFTLQILDQGQTLLFPLPSGKAILGSDEASDIRLGEAGVEPAHVRFDSSSGGVLLTPLAPIKLNGEAIADAGDEAVRLELGDRLEVGRAVAVVGRSVARAAAPDDVLDGPRRSAGRRRQAAPPNRSKLPFIAIGAAIVLVALLGVLSSSAADEIDGELSVIVLARDKGDIAHARRYVGILRERWQGETDGRLDQLEAEAAKVEAIATAEAKLERQVLDPTSGTYAAWVRRLQRIETSGEDHERIAARLLRSRLRETLATRSAAPVPVAAGPQVDDSAGASDGGNATAEPAPQRPDVEAAAVVADADRLVEQGLYVQALELLRSQMGASTDAVVVDTLRRRFEAIEAAALTAMQALVAGAESAAQAGDSSAAITKLALAQHRFPAGARFHVLGETLARLESAAREEQRSGTPVARGPKNAGSAATPALPMPTPTPGPGTGDAVSISQLRDQLDRIRDAEAAGAFARAATLLRSTIAGVEDRDPDYAGRLAARAREAEQRAAFHAAVRQALDGGKSFAVELHDGGELQLDGATDDSLRAGQRVVQWPELGPAGIAALAKGVAPAGAAAAGAASLLYAAGDAAAAEQLLVADVRADPARQDAVAEVLARGRGDAPGSGYELRGSQFVAVHAIEVEKAADKIASRIDGVFRKRDADARREFVDELLREGPEHLAAIGVAFQRDLAKQIDKLEGSPLRKQIQTLEEQREALDRARIHAKELIYDEEKYFYPYKPPAVSGERHAEYVRVQAEVNRRIGALRALWLDRRFSVRVPRSLRTALERIEWDTRVLQRVGAFDARQIASIGWARAVPAVRNITIAEYCRTPEERDELLLWQRIEEYNKAVGRDLSSSVRELLRITNDYRLMYRHRPLAVAPKVCAAAQGHAEEMSRLGYFAHMSPTPERRTPFDRMKLAGYSYGVSENIALNGSAMGAHNSWLGSSGHHRNLLHPDHREMGIGVDGRNWVENFGRGKTYERHEAFEDAGGR